jgi:hypothetical protein
LNDGPAAAKTASSHGFAPAAGLLALSAKLIRVAALERFCALRGWDLAAVVHEVEPTKPRCARPALACALERAMVGDICCLVVTELGYRRQQRATARRGSGEVKRGNRVEGGR